MSIYKGYSVLYLCYCICNRKSFLWGRKYQFLSVCVCVSRKRERERETNWMKEVVVLGEVETLMLVIMTLVTVNEGLGNKILRVGVSSHEKRGHQWCVCVCVGAGQTERANRWGKQASRQIYVLRIITDRHYNNNNDKDGWMDGNKFIIWRANAV